jgi:hypothetical protein
MSERASPVFDTGTLSALRSVGGVLPADLISAVLAGGDLPGLSAGDYHLELGVSPREAANRAWTVLTGAWAAYRDAMSARPPGDPATGLTRERWLSVLLRELGFGRVPATPAGGLVADGRSWPVSHLADHRVPVHLLGWAVSLDKRTPGMAGAAERAPHGMLQELLNRSDEYLWALLTNGSTLRILRDSSALVGPAYVEFDLAAIFDNELYSDFVALYLLCHQSRFEPTDPELGLASCWLERWRSHAVEAGARALGALRIGVHDAIEALGTGLVSHPANAGLRADLEARRLSEVDIQRGLLRLVYRILFCFVAEDRALLLDPDADPVARARYHRWFSTARLRRIALRRAGDGHHDLWEGLGVVLSALGREEGCAPLGLVGLGGIFDPGPSDLDPGLLLDNRSLLAALRHLCITRPDPNGPRRVVDYRHLGAEELGGIYESLLEYVPRYDPIARTFNLVSVAGNERKKTGAYYTPTWLTESLLDTALDPLLDRAESQPDPEAALLALTVCDPACGSGHFLVAAGRRIAARVATCRAEGAEPTFDDLHAAMHDAVAHCLFGVDVNPLAAELAKVSLWLEGMQAGRALSLLDGHIKVGNALLGATPALLADGIPDAAFTAIEGDDKKIASALKRLNKAQRSGQGSLASIDVGSIEAPSLAAAAASIDALMPQDLADIHVAAQHLRSLEDSEEARRARRIADAWCAAFVLPKVPGAPELTHASLAAVGDGSASPELLDAIATASAHYRWFHWHLEFPQVFPAGRADEVDPVTGWGGGFACVIGNPPWEHVELKEQEWFAARMPSIAEASGEARKQLIVALAADYPELFQEYRAALRQADGERGFLSNSGRYSLAGRGRINTYAVFAEANRSLLAPTGRLGVILPTGIATDATTQYFFKDLVTTKALVTLYDFENALPLFEGVHRSFKFCLLTLTGRQAPVEAAWFAFFARHPDDLNREGVRFRLTPEEITLLNPNTGTCPVFRTRRDAEITLGIYRMHPVLIRHGDGDGNPWGLSFMQGLFNMTSDSGLFHAREQLEAEGWVLDGNVFRRGAEAMLPLYEAKMIHHYDHRWATYANDGDVRDVTEAEHADPYFVVLPRYWVARGEVDSRLAGRWKHDWLLVYRRICRSTDMRTAIDSVLPLTATSDGSPNVLSDHADVVALQCVLSSLVLDFCVRQRVGGTHLDFFNLFQAPVPHPSSLTKSCAWDRDVSFVAWTKDRIRELTYNAWDMAPLARDLGDKGPPFVWNPGRREVLTAELDAALFYLYGINRDDTEYILSTFPIANRKDPDLSARVLGVYDRIATAIESGAPFVSTLDPPPGHGRRHEEPFA